MKENEKAANIKTQPKQTSQEPATEKSPVTATRKTLEPNK